MIGRIKSKGARMVIYGMAAVCLGLASLIAGCLAGVVPPSLLLAVLNLIVIVGCILFVIWMLLVIWRVSYWRGRKDEYDERNKRG